MAYTNSRYSGDFFAASALAMDENNPTSLLYRRKFKASPRLDPLPDCDEIMPGQTRLPQPPSISDFRSWLDQPDDQGYYSRHRPSAAYPRGALAEYNFRGQQPDDFRSDFVRDGWSPEPPSRQCQRESSALNESVRAFPAVLDMSFLELYPPGHITISYSNEAGSVERIHGIHQDPLDDCSFLLSQAVDGGNLHLEACGSLTIRPFLQYVYTNTYHLPTPTGEILEDVPTSLLIHCQMFRLGDIYDIPELKSFANVQIIRQCEFGCSSPDRPVDLCAAIDYVYKNMSEHVGVVETIVAYCVTCFLSHGLGSHFDFRRLAFDLRPFHQDLCKVGMERRFEDNQTAQAIIQMPFKPYAPSTYASREDRRAKQIFDDVYHLHGDDGDLAHKSRRLSKQPLTNRLAHPRMEEAYNEHEEDHEDYGLDGLSGLRHSSQKQKEHESGKQAGSNGAGLSHRQKRQLPQLQGTPGTRDRYDRFDLDYDRANIIHPRHLVEASNAPASSGLDTANAVDIEQTQALVKKQVAFSGVAEGETERPGVAANEEPKVEVSRELFNNLVSAGLTGKPGRQASRVARPATNYKIRELCAALAKDELDKAKSDADYEVVAGPDSDSDMDFVKVEPDQAHSSESDRGTEPDVGGTSDSEWDMV
ncbi:hypothetical protein Slin15195_G088910 [Septoria linicola]|uniref:Uncharacterized protein n=1 Tax=Septoria linicola TaxID=215465 RepID=A0A9Q9B168_9PEZI|nr:hypothetical protein Slin15195_G088910 [Septoria linicola]